MSSFSSIFAEKHAEVRSVLSAVRCPSVERLRDLLASSEHQALGLAELAELLEIGATCDADEQRQLLRETVARRSTNLLGNRVRYVAPIYVSSYCVDACPYCNFSATRKSAIRKRLSLKELEEEVRLVLARDMRVIELVYATDPEFTTDLLVRYVAKVAEMLDDQPGSGVLLCTEYLTSEAYAALRDAGLWGIVQWDETLDPDAYRKWHSQSPQKREFLLRMDNHDRAMSAGLEVATGALFGLADFRYDALMQIAKARHLEVGVWPRPICSRHGAIETDRRPGTSLSNGSQRSSVRDSATRLQTRPAGVRALAPDPRNLHHESAQSARW